jgi:O-antigen ligase
VTRADPGQAPGQAEDAPDQLQSRWTAAIVDVFVYVVVLNLFVEYLPQVVTETFTLSLLTAVLLKGVLEVVVLVKNRVKARFRAASTPAGKAVAGALLWAVLFGSKFLVLEAVNLVFSDRVSLGGFFSVTLLILVLLLSREAGRGLLRAPGTHAGRHG